MKRLSPGEGERTKVRGLTFAGSLVQRQTLTLPLSLFEGRGARANGNNSP
jgi:hypothetical protein